MEELVHANGQVENPNLGDYYIPTSMDVSEIKTFIVEYPGALGPYGAKAMGEPPIDLPAAAVANAVSHALGIGISEIPVKPDKIVEWAKTTTILS
jgi:CO/xanthine dehydrogenase Mo-binding subunit